MLRALAPYLAYSVLSVVKWTTRIHWRDKRHYDELKASGQKFVYAFWHNRQVYFTTSHRYQGISILVSLSRDGAIIAKVMDLSGFAAVRGSASRGGAAAVREILSLLEQGHEVGLTPDGPKGPVYEVKDGVLFIAQKLGIPILPITNATSRKLVLKRSWDKYQVPLPFAKSVVRYGRPIWVKEGDDSQRKAAELKAELDRITRLADAEVGG